MIDAMSTVSSAACHEGDVVEDPADLITLVEIARMCDFVIDAATIRRRIRRRLDGDTKVNAPRDAVKLGKAWLVHRLEALAFIERELADRRTGSHV